MTRVQTRRGDVFEVVPLAGILNVFDVRAVSTGRRVGFIQRSPFCLIPSRRSLAAARLLDEIYRRAVAGGLIPLRVNARDA